MQNAPLPPPRPPCLAPASLLVILDTETTGFYPEQGDEIIELAAEKVLSGVVVERFHALVRPTGPVPPEVVAIHGLEGSFLKQHGAAAGDVFPRFAAFAEGAVLVGHNIRRFDYPFLAAHFAKLALPALENDLLDTLELARERLTLPNYKLATVAAHFGVSTAGAHRAASDVAITRQVLARLLDLGSRRPADG